MGRYTRRLVRAVGRRTLKRMLKRRPGRSVTLVTQGRIPVFTPEFQSLLNPDHMYSSALYAPDGLRRALSGGEIEWYSRMSLIVRLAQVEQLCLELDFRPGPDFWASVLTADAASESA